MDFKIEIGLNAIASYRRLDYKIWYALAEYIDNSTQSYFNNREMLDARYEAEEGGLEVSITYDRSGEENVIRIVDNAMGMNKSDLQHALIVASPPDLPSGRCRYGLGMKTASCWIGNRWVITTKKLGDTTEFTAEIDVAKIESGEASLKTSTIEDLNPDAHYTRIEIYQHNREFKGRTISKIKDYLKSMYRQDFRAGILNLYYNAEPLTWEEFDNRIRKNRAGELSKKEFIFEVNGKIVTGWAAVLEKGARSDSGFSMLHSGRVVKGWPDAWRPERIFGLNRNDLLNQRLIGEINLEDFEVTHTKDNIQWYGTKKS